MKYYYLFTSYISTIAKRTFQGQLSREGFTLVELLVVLGLFTSIATLSLGALFNAHTINGRLQETQAILDNINLSTQTVIRDIRFGSDFYATSTLSTSVPIVRRNCIYGGPDVCSVLIFRPSDAVNSLDRTAYYVKSGVLYKDNYPKVGAAETLQMTSDEVTIKSLTFYVKGANTSDGSSDEFGLIDYEQPLIVMLLTGVTKPSTRSIAPVTFSIQTSMSARELDNK